MSLDEPRIFSVSKRGHGAPGSSALEGGGTPPAMEDDWHIGGEKSSYSYGPTADAARHEI